MQKSKIQNSALIKTLALSRRTYVPNFVTIRAETAEQREHGRTDTRHGRILDPPREKFTCAQTGGSEAKRTPVFDTIPLASLGELITTFATIKICLPLRNCAAGSQQASCNLCHFWKGLSLSFDKIGRASTAPIKLGRMREREREREKEKGRRST